MASTPKIQWAYQSFLLDSIDDVLSQINDFLDKLTPSQARYAKVDTCETNSNAQGKAQGVVYYINSDDNTLPCMAPGVSNWTYQKAFSSRSPNDAYQGGLEIIQGLSDGQALSCNVGTSLNNQGLTVCVWWGQTTSCVGCCD